MGMLDAVDQVRFFLERGGSVLLVIMITVMLMWALIIERIWFFTRSWSALSESIRSAWQARPEHHSWHAHQIRQATIAEAQGLLQRSLPTIKTLVAICPLFGLLGTVTGMIEVFDVMAILGSGSPKAMASGISKATIPTMGGMVGALSGVFAITLLQRMADQRKEQLEDSLTFQESLTNKGHSV